MKPTHNTMEKRNYPTRSRSQEKESQIKEKRHSMKFTELPENDEENQAGYSGGPGNSSNRPGSPTNSVGSNTSKSSRKTNQKNQRAYGNDDINPDNVNYEEGISESETETIPEETSEYKQIRKTKKEIAQENAKKIVEQDDCRRFKDQMLALCDNRFDTGGILSEPAKRALNTLTPA